MRHWCAYCHYPKKPRFMIGTVQADTELEAERLLIELVDELFPIRPIFDAFIPGLITFKPEEDSDDDAALHG